MTRQQHEQRIEAYNRSSGLCPICKKPISCFQPQYAHKIANKEMWRKKYGSWVVDHTCNGEYVCSLACNQAVDTGSSYGNHLDVIADVLIAEYVKMWKVDGLGKLSDKIMAKYREMGFDV